MTDKQTILNLLSPFYSINDYVLYCPGGIFDSSYQFVWWKKLENWQVDNVMLNGPSKVSQKGRSLMTLVVCAGHALLLLVWQWRSHTILPDWLLHGSVGRLVYIIENYTWLSALCGDIAWLKYNIMLPKTFWVICRERMYGRMDNGEFNSSPSSLREAGNKNRSPIKRFFRDLLARHGRGV